MKTEKDSKGDGMAFLVISGVGIALIAFLLWGIPTYSVWRQKLAGEGELVRAEQTKKITIETARVEVEAAKLRAQAIGIMGEAAKQYPEYRLQEFMGAFAEALQEGNIEQIIYVPTEANIPIMEAGRR